MCILFVCTDAWPCVYRIDSYRLDPVDGMFVDTEPVAVTADDAALFPTGLVLARGVLYVAEAGRDRVDAFILGIDGIPSTFPSSSTVVVADSFPNDVAFGVFPP